MAKKKQDEKQQPKRQYNRKMPTATELNQQLQILSAEKQSYQEKSIDLHNTHLKAEKEIIELKAKLKKALDVTPDITEITLANAKITKLEETLKLSLKAVQAEVEKTRRADATREEYKTRNKTLIKRIDDFNNGDFWHRFVTEGGHV